MASTQEEKVQVAETTPAVEETTAPAVEETAAPAVEETTAPAVEETTAPAVEETTAPAVEETAAPAVEETTAPAVEETAPAVEETTAPAVEETTAPAVEESTAPAVEETAAPAPAVEETAPKAAATEAPVEAVQEDKEEAVESQIDPSLLMAAEEIAAPKKVAEETVQKPKKRRRKRRMSLTANIGITQDVKDAIAEVRMHDDSINAVLFEVVKTSQRKFTMTHAWMTGGGLTALKEELQNRFAQRCFAILRCQTNDDHGHEGDKFVYIRFLTPECPVLLKAKTTVYMGQIDGAVGHFCMAIDADEYFQDEITPEVISKEIVRLAGSDKPHWIYFGDGHTWDCREDQYQ